MNWDEYLHESESVVWQGRPAPRCFVFRNWLHSVFGLVILILTIGWFIFGLHLGSEEQNAFISLLPVPFLFVGIYLTFGHLLLSRFEWEHVFYAMTDRRLIAIRGLFNRRMESVALVDVIWFELRPLGEQLGTVRIRCRDLEQKLTLSCIEHPRKLTDLLEESMAANGIDTGAKPV